MKKRYIIRIKKRWLMAVVCIWLLLSLWMGAAAEVRAAESDRMPTIDGQSSLQINLFAIDPALPNGKNQISITSVELQLIKVADVSVNGGSASYQLLPEYQKSGIIFEELQTVTASNVAAKLLATMLREEAARVERTDEEGIASFSEIEPGMYLVYQKEGANILYGLDEIAPMLISLPEIKRSEAGNSWNYAVTLNPKTALMQEESAEELPTLPDAGEDHTTSPAPSNPNTNQQISTGGTSGSSGTQSTLTTGVKTGDTNEAILLLIVAGCAAIIVTKLLRAKKLSEQ